jgi:FixJ family two-component response regulator
MDEGRPYVFVMDDDRCMRESLHDLLSAAGLTVQMFASAHALLTSQRPEAPSCLGLDIQLPGLSGLELLQELAKVNAPMPIMCITGYGDIPMTVRAMQAGASDFLTKPFRDEDLRTAVAQALHHGQQMVSNTHGMKYGVSSRRSIRSATRQYAGIRERRTVYALHCISVPLFPRTLFLVAYRHGLRASEIGLLQLVDVDVKQGRMAIHRLKGLT